MTTRALAFWIECVSWGFVALGLVLPFAFGTAAFSLYRDALAAWAYGPGATIPAADAALLHLMLGITGGSIAGKWIVHAFLARGPLAEGRAWARDLTLRGLAAWFVADSAASLALGAAFNVWMINLVPLALAGVPLVLSYGKFHDDDSGSLPPIPKPSKRTSSAATWCVATSVLGAGAGVAIAFGGRTPLFAPWFDGLATALYGGAALADPARRVALFFFGPIGGCTLAQFAMLAGLARRCEGRPATAIAGAASIAAWFVVDSAWGLGGGGLFNVAMINVPALAITLPPWVLLALRLRAADD